MKPNLAPFLAWLIDQGKSATTAAGYLSYVNSVFRAHTTRKEDKLNAATLRDYHASLSTPRRATARVAWRHFLAFAASRGVVDLPDVAEATRGPTSSVALSLPPKVTERNRAIHSFVTRLGYETARNARWTTGTLTPPDFEHVLIAPGLTVPHPWFLSLVRVMFPEPPHEIIVGWPMIGDLKDPTQFMPTDEVKEIALRVQDEIDDGRLTMWDATPEATATVARWAAARAARAPVEDHDLAQRRAEMARLFGK